MRMQKPSVGDVFLPNGSVCSVGLGKDRAYWISGVSLIKIQ